MASLFVTSVEPYAGKTAICIGLIGLFARAGLSVGYMKPLGTTVAAIDGAPADEDALFVSRVANLSDSIDDICPVLLTQELREAALRQAIDRSEALVAAHRRLSEGRDVLVMESSGTLSTGYIVGLPPRCIAQLTDASVVAVVRYNREMSADEILLAKDLFSKRLAGVIVNYVPEEDRPMVHQHLSEYFLARENIRLLGVLPVDPLLNAITVGELASLLRGRILCRPDKQDELVETFAIGAMTADSALRYFLRSPNKAVITGGDRSEIQLAALQTSTKAIILT
ncbi:MAG: AAA family ATPase, partial [Chloroflexi bacterium]|nr:AAA family ATPase [Chloroflexota bacterium]